MSHFQTAIISAAADASQADHTFGKKKASDWTELVVYSHFVSHRPGAGTLVLQQ